MRITFYTDQISTNGDGITLPDAAVIDNVEYLSMGEYVKVAYHVVQKDEADEPESTPEA